MTASCLSECKVERLTQRLYPDIFFPFANLSSFNYSSGPTNGFILTPSSQLPLGICTESVRFKKGVSLEVPIKFTPKLPACHFTGSHLA